MRIDLVSEHASPLAAIGGVDAGGQNVHVAALAAGLAERGHDVTVHTRRDDASLPERVVVQDGYNVVHVTAGPAEQLPKDELLQHMPAFARVLRFDPGHAGALYHQGAALARQRQYDRAVAAWERVVQLDPGGPYAAQARSRARSARDMQHIFAASAG